MLAGGGETMASGRSKDLLQLGVAERPGTGAQVEKGEANLKMCHNSRETVSGRWEARGVVGVASSCTGTVCQGVAMPKELKKKGSRVVSYTPYMDRMSRRNRKCQ